MYGFDNIKPEWALESRIVKASLCYFGHVIRAGGMKYEVMGGYRSRETTAKMGGYHKEKLLWNYLQHDASLKMYEELESFCHQ